MDSESLSWEETLDIDTSPVCPPSKRSHLIPSLQRCSQIPLSSSQSQQSPPPPPPLPIPFTTLPPPLIPGPAGAIQMAMLHRLHRNPIVSNIENHLPTQDLLKQMQQVGEDEQDFNLNPSWIYAIDFLTNSITNQKTVQLNSLEKCETTARLPQVVVLVKSCVPNGLGDLTLTLKDLSATVNATVHRKVLTESDFGNDISVGAVLILHQVVAFSPRVGAHYLNITINNVFKVIRKDIGPPTEEEPTPAANSASSAGESREPRARMIDKEAFVRWGTAEGIMNEAARRRPGAEGSVDDGKQLEESTTVAGSLPISSSSKCQHPAIEVELTLVSKGGVRPTVEVGKGDGSNELMTDGVTQPVEAVSQNSNFIRSEHQYSDSAAIEMEHHPNDDGETERTSGVKQMHQLIPKFIQPEWTDEQLDELFDEL